jgi:cytochrome oxidase assembly protein ShyY1
VSRTSRERRLPLALRRPAWLAGLAAVAVFATAAALLGSWQWDRGEATDRRDAAVAAHWDLPPADPAEVLVDGTVPRAAEWTPVRLAGRYDAGTVLVRNRPVAGRPGLLVVSPFRLDRPVGDPARDTVWVVRGWVPSGAETAPPVPPAGRTTVVTRIRAAEDPSGRTAPPGQAHRVAPEELATAVSTASSPEGVGSSGAVGTAVSGYGILAEGEPGGGGLSVLDRPARDPGPHLAYALQWWAFALAAFAIWLVSYRRAARDEAGTDESPTNGPGGRRRTGEGRAARSASDPWTYHPGPQ